MWYLTIHESKVYVKDRIINKLIKAIPQFCDDVDVIITKCPQVEEDLYNGLGGEYVSDGTEPVADNNR